MSLILSEEYEPTSTLHYVNSQLIAHGFAPSPGLSLDGLAKDDCDKIVKCLLGMLSQRMEDLGRTEELSSKLRMLNYEHERLQSMHRTAVDIGANAEREMNLYKSKLAGSQRSLTCEISSHKQTLSELQRTRTSLQYLRSTTQNELKRKDKEVERVLERWNKVADAQVKLAGVHSSLQCANLVAGNEDRAGGKGLMEEALEQAEDARCGLVKENEGFRSVILGTANAIQGIVYSVKNLGADSIVDGPTPISHTALFAPPTSSLPHPDNSHAKLRELISAFREAVSTISSSSTPAKVMSPETEEEITKLKDLVKSLRNELEESRQSSTTAAAQAQAVLDRFTTQASERLITGRDLTPEEAVEMSMELIGVTENDELREKLDKRTKELDTERKRFTDATVKLGKDKAALEIERARLLEEKRRWAVEQMLADLPPTPGPDPDLISPPRPERPRLKQISASPPRVRQQRKASGYRAALKSPSKKISVAKRMSSNVTDDKPESPIKLKKQRRESTMFETVDAYYDSEVPQRELVESKDETESGLQRSTTPEDSPPVVAPPSLVSIMKTSLPLVLPTTFTLPPPSPASSLAARDLGPMASAPPNSSSSVASFDAIPLAASAPPVAPLPRSRKFPSPRTPRPLVNAHMKHAYSPARPSPLSRILMIANSPPSPCSVPPIQEEDEETADKDINKSPDSCVGTGVPPKRNLAQERKLGVPIDEPSPLREKTVADLNGNVAAQAGVIGTSGKNILTHQGEKRFTAKEKGKGRAVPVVRGLAATEKENIVDRTQSARDGKTQGTAGASGKNAGARIKPIKLAEAETKNVIVTGKSGFKPPATAVRITTSSGPVRLSGNAPQSGTGSAAAANVKPSVRRRVPVGSANASKLESKRF